MGCHSVLSPSTLSANQVWDSVSMRLPLPGRGRGRRAVRGGSSFKIRLIMALGMALFAFVSYFMNSDVNPITGEKQRVSADLDTPEEEMALGLSARDEMAAQHGGLARDAAGRQRVIKIGEELLFALDRGLREAGRSNPYKFEFHLLEDPKTVNAFALPGGQVFVTNALYKQLNDAQVAGVIGHEIGHVLARHGAQRMARAQLDQGLTRAAGVAAGDMRMAQMAAMAVSLSSKSHGRDQEYESDKWGVQLMAAAGYDPHALIEVMDVLEASAGGSSPPEFLSTHPIPANRRDKIRQHIAAIFPDGVPAEFQR